MAKVRTLTEINQDYFQTAAILGDLVWKVCKFTGEDIGGGQIAELKRKLRTIDTEMDEYQKQQEKNKTKNGTETQLLKPQTTSPEVEASVTQ